MLLASTDIQSQQKLISPDDVCEHEKIDFEQKKSNDALMIKLKTELYQEVRDFQGKILGQTSTRILFWAVLLGFCHLDRKISFSQATGSFDPRKPGFDFCLILLDITVDRIVQVDFLSSSWFLSAELVKTLFIETPFTFMTGEDLHLRYAFYFNYVRIGHRSKSEMINGGKHSPRLCNTMGSDVKQLEKKAYIVVSGGSFCPCEDAAAALKWPKPQDVQKLTQIVQTWFFYLDHRSLRFFGWLIFVPQHCPNWNRMTLSINIITQNRANSLARLLKALSDAYYIGDQVPITFNMDSKVDAATIQRLLTHSNLASTDPKLFEEGSSKEA
ncbi:hypothetical protein HAX54_026452 [Datura stramonium]|uniref:Uncharacterized protein n=1 Tax=Datura stramonium TaxID=4076 RepID=A0ABS8V181_DATST|nr:hypothetical protein [Datura stramonium]